MNRAPNSTNRFYQRTLFLASAMLIGLASVSLTGCGNKSHGGGPPGGPGGFSVPVVLGEVKQEATTESAEFLAELSSDASTVIRAQVAGRITQILVGDGQHVRKGQALFQLDASQQAAALKGLEASAMATSQETAVVQDAMHALQANRAAVETDLAFNRKQLERYQSLLTTNSVSQKDVEQYETMVKTLESKLASTDADIQGKSSRVAQIKANVQRDKAAADSARSNLAFYTVRAPYSGTLGNIMARVGDVADPSIPLTSLTNNNALELNIAVPAEYRSKVHAGSRLVLENDAGETQGQARVFFVSPTVDPMSQTTLVKAKVNNAGGSTFATSQRLKAKLVLGQRQSLLVPMSAVVRMAGQPFVYTAVHNEPDTKQESGKKAIPVGLVAKMQIVTLGNIVGESYQVVSGLSPHQTIIVSGVQKLRDGVPVKPIESDKSGPKSKDPLTAVAN